MSLATAPEDRQRPNATRAGTRAVIRHSGWRPVSHAAMAVLPSLAATIRSPASYLSEINSGDTGMSLSASCARCI